MNELNIYSLGGIHHELYNPDIDSLFLTELSDKGVNSLRDANALFWSLHLQEDRVFDLLEVLGTKENPFARLSKIEEDILSDPHFFVNKVSAARKCLCDQGLTEQEFFSHLECLAILCNMYSNLIYHPFTLTIHEGFLLNKLSSLDIITNCLLPSCNPYISFIKEHCLPIILRAAPDIIWLNGRVTHSSIAMARLARTAFPHVHISIVNHSSEYYSLNKIQTLLTENYPLFHVIDSIILDDANETRNDLITALSTGLPLDRVFNIMYASRDEGTFVIRTTKHVKRTGVDIQDYVSIRPKSKCHDDIQIEPAKVANIKLWPEHICYWNKCTFCGINAKYIAVPEDNKADIWSTDKELAYLEDLSAKGVEYLWLEDEAIPPQTLFALAQRMLDSDIRFIWQARSRISREFTDATFCKTLAIAGLTELRLGLESASPHVLELMNKFSEELDLNLVRDVVRVCHEAGISVHFPMIIGFPGETSKDRKLTYDFLRELKLAYPSFTFNINILGLDIASFLYKDAEKYGINAVMLPCEPRFFLGNLVDWENTDVPFDKAALEQERDDVMRTLLYPWMPEENSPIAPHLFYRLTETIRNTLTFKASSQRLLADRIISHPITEVFH